MTSPLPLLDTPTHSHSSQQFATPPPSPPTIPSFPLQSQSQPSLTSLPSHYISKYASFVRTNSSEITRFESLLRNLILFLPSHSSRSSAQLTTEAAHTLLTLLTTFHTSILAPQSNDPGYRPTPKERWQCWAKGGGGTAPGNSSKWGFSRSSIYTKAFGLLRLVQYIQLLLEMVAKRAGEGMRWRVVVLLETVKAICRFVMLRATGNRSIVGSEIGGEEQVRRTTDEDGAVVEASVEEEGWQMPRTGLRLPDMPSLAAGETIMGFLEKRVVTPDEIKAAQRLVRRLETMRASAAEVLWILRPVVYALVLQKVRGNRKDWRPWVLGVGMELLSRQLAKGEIRENVPGGLGGLSAVEKEEMGKRGGDMAWWGMRGAFYDSLTGPWIKAVVKKLRGKPVLDMVGAVVEDYEFLWEEFYFSTATM